MSRRVGSPGGGADQAAKLVADHPLTRDLALLNGEDRLDGGFAGPFCGDEAQRLRAARAGGFLQRGDDAARALNGGIPLGLQPRGDALGGGGLAKTFAGLLRAVFDLGEEGRLRTWKFCLQAAEAEVDRTALRASAVRIRRM